MKRIAIFILIALAGGVVALGLYRLTEKKHPAYSIYAEPGLPVRQASYTAAPPMNEPDFETAAEMSVHAVVHIKTEFQQKSSVYDDFFDFFNFHQYPDDRSNPITAMASGVIITSDGYIVTNNHVVQDATKITITLNDKRVYEAKIIGTDPSTDLALIKIDETNLPFLTFGNSDDVKIGQWVLAVGNPFNLTSTVTAGIVSAKARDINILGSQSAIESFIQTDAAVNPGNSGGALVDTKGQLIGINAAIASGTGNYVGYSFAIPVNIVKKVVDDFMKFGKIQRAALGVYYKEVDDQLAKEINLPQVKGVYVEDVVQGGAAELAGIRKGDVIYRIGDRTINGKSELLEEIGQHNPGDKMEVGLYRDGKELTLPLTLQSSALNQENKITLLGATFEKIGANDMKRFGLQGGFKITHLEDGVIRDAGIKTGFIVVAVDRQAITSSQDLREALTSKRGGVLIEGVYPNGMRAYYGIGL
ncbi:MAG TPA: Do family serine endopeptidase [Bacteroidales bacterium]|nr:Do family serine endopeptidase [Bacteroidales bacterium]